HVNSGLSYAAAYKYSGAIKPLEGVSILTSAFACSRCSDKSRTTIRPINQYEEFAHGALVPAVLAAPFPLTAAAPDAVSSMIAPWRLLTPMLSSVVLP